MQNEIRCSCGDYAYQEEGYTSIFRCKCGNAYFIPEND